MVLIVLLEGAERDAVYERALAQIQYVMHAIPDLGNERGAVPSKTDDPAPSPT
ncbi:hypothetical protein [Massilia sp. H6]|uniref:hypothetical protein n=1 Tax=Massilia sp. H6 TaxID=2970464 RepID=UPI002169AE19|nr:hypothetical protein [Massilia sp. H6]UVW30727.1 hypothetical protein NRS07_20030 [Massilia sp. H6]